MTSHIPAPLLASERLSLTRVAALLVFVVAALLAAGVGLMFSLGPFDGWFAGGALASYAVIAAVLIARIGGFHPHARFGAGNGVTLLRLMLTCLIAGLTLQCALTDAPPAAVVWSLFAAAVAAMVLDGIDGPLARRQGLVSSFGSRFDMETDALLILLLSVAVFVLGKAGAWVLIGGVLRYAYIVAGWQWPALTAPLPQSMRRKTICVVQSAALILAVLPPIIPPASAVIAIVALVLLVYSFAADALWSMRRYSSPSG